MNIKQVKERSINLGIALKEGNINAFKDLEKQMSVASFLCKKFTDALYILKK